MRKLFNNSGGAYILVIVCTLVSFTLTGGLIYTHSNAVFAANAYSHNLAAYEAALSGVTYTVSFLQNSIDMNIDEINEDTLNKILLLPIDERTDYIYQTVFAETALSHINTLPASYTLSLGVDNGTINVLYNITIQIAQKNDTITINSTAKNAETNLGEQVYAVASFAPAVTEEHIYTDDVLNGIRVTDQNACKLNLVFNKSLT